MTSLGERLRLARTRRGCTQRALAEKTQLTAAFLSQVERDQVMPSITTLQRIAAALELPIAHLIEEPANKSPIVRQGERMVLRLPGSSVDRHCLTPSLNHRLQIFEVHLEAGQRSSEQPYSHPSEEFILVLEGELEIELDDTVHHLREGDTILYNGVLPHYTCCSGDRPVKYIVVNTPPVV